MEALPGGLGVQAEGGCGRGRAGDGGNVERAQ
jgi:hypothetical protein